MHSKTILIAALLAYAEARFQQEGKTSAIIAAVDGGEPGAAATIAGASISDLLGAANACDKLTTADQIVAELGGGADAIAAAIAHVAAEKNTNPDANGNAQKVCADPALPVTAELRGITSLIDPAVDVNGEVNALSAQTQAAPLDATGKSMFDLIVDAGLGEFVQGQDSDGSIVEAGAAAGGAAAGNEEVAADAGAEEEAAAVVDDAQAAACEAAPAPVATEAAAANNTGNEEEAAAGNEEEAAGGNQAGAGAADPAVVGAADFGLCTPTIVFEAGVNNRKADEFTFQIADATARGGQSEALNPAIITNALCDALVNSCDANDAAVALCRDAEEQALALNARNKAVADTFNAAIGFAGAVTNPSGGPADVGDVAAARKRAIRFRA